MRKIGHVLIICVLVGCSPTTPANPVSGSNAPSDSIATVSNTPPVTAPPIAKDDHPSHVRPKSLKPIIGARHSPEEKKAFEQYDNEMINRIKGHWNELMESDSIKKKQFTTGRVVVGYRLYPDGHISDVKVISCNVSEVFAYVCVSAVSDPAPYAGWNPEMRKMVGTDFREIRFTFNFE